MTAISTYRYFSSTTTTAHRAVDTGTGPSQGGVLSHTVENRKTHSYYYGVQSATFTPSNGKANASGVYTSNRRVCDTGTVITQSSLGTGVKTATGKNPATGSIKSYGSQAIYTNRPWETSKTTSSVIYSSAGTTTKSPSRALNSTCVTCR